MPEELLAEVAEINPWRFDDEEGTYNICRFCDGVFKHEEDCLWAKIRRYFNLDVET